MTQLVSYARFDETGRYFVVGWIAAGSSILQEPDVYVGQVDPTTQFHGPNGPTLLPEKPVGEHDFDWVTKTWVPNLERAKAAVKYRIEAERDERVFAPTIVYDGKNLDADAISIERLANKLAALDAYEKVGLEMPAPMLVWRDADNITHVFATHAEYKTWLAGFAVALDLRGTQAFAWSWLKKSELDGVTTVEDLLAFDPTT